MVCPSGGKRTDKQTMPDIPMSLKRQRPHPFRSGAVNLDQKQTGFPARAAEYPSLSASTSRSW